MYIKFRMNECLVTIFGFMFLFLFPVRRISGTSFFKKSQYACAATNLI